METVDEIEDKEYATALGAVVNSGPETCVQAVHTLESVVRKMGYDRLVRVHRKYTPEVVKGLVSEELGRLILRTREMRDAEFSRNDDLRSRGTPFVERMKLLDNRKIEWCDREEERLTKLSRTFRVAPVHLCFDEVDYEAAREMGMGWIIKTKLDQIAT